MGITGLLKFGEYVDGVVTMNDCIQHYMNEKGRAPRIAFDMSVLFHMYMDDYEAKHCYEVMHDGNPLTVNDIKGYYGRLNDFLASLKCSDIWLVFDGKGIPYKEDTMVKRRSTRDEMYKLGKYKQCIESPWNHYELVHEMMALDEAMGSTHKPWHLVKAPCEADAQLYFLQREDLVDIIVTVDSDVIAYGADRVFFMSPPRYFIKDLSHAQPSLFRIDHSVKLNDVPSDVIIVMAWLLGNDYSKGIARVGQKSVLKMLDGCEINRSTDRDTMVKNILEQYINSDAEKKMNSIAKTCEKHHINRESVYQQLHLLFKIFKTYPVFNPIFECYCTLDQRKFTSIDAWRSE